MAKRKNHSEGNVSSGVFGFVEKGLGAIIDLIFAKKNHFQVFPKGELTRHWQEIESLEPKLSIIEADKLVDNILKKAGVRGESIAERLRKVEKLVPRHVYNDMWEAHKVRNRLVHEIDHAVNLNNSNDVIFKMKKFLVAIGAFQNE